MKTVALNKSAVNGEFFKGLKVNGLSTAYGKQKVLDNLNFKASNGRVTGIIGPNGAGKTTLLKCLAGIIKPSSGKVEINSIDLSEISSLEKARIIGYVPQKSPESAITVFESVLIGRKPHIGYRASDHDLWLTQEVLHYMDLENIAFKKTDRISGGEFQKTLIARVLVREPKILLMDEPANNLDLKSQVRIMDLILHSARKHDMSVIVTLHDINMAFRCCDNLIIMNKGHIEYHGETESIEKVNLEKVFDVELIEAEINGRRIFMPSYKN